jgi:hypothetical protein
MIPSPVEQIAAESSPDRMTRPPRTRRLSDRDRIKRLFLDEADVERLRLIARLEAETRLYAGARARA